MTLSDSDRLLVNDGSETNTITFAQFKDGTVLNPTDLFLVNDGTKTETISWEQIEDELGPKGIVNTPAVLKPKDGAGSGDERFLKTDAIVEVEGGGIITCETELIENVDDTSVIYTWSNDLTGSAVATSKAFDGDLNTIANSIPGGTLTWTNTQNITGPLRLYSKHPTQSQGDVHAAATKITVTTSADGTGVTNQQCEVGWNTIEYTGTVQSITVNSTNGAYSAIINAIEFEDNILVDLEPIGKVTLTFPSSNGFDCFEPGDVLQSTKWNQAQIWSNNQFGSLQNPGTSFFDGGTAVLNWATPAGDAGFNFTGLLNVTKLEVFFSTGGDYASGNLSFPYKATIDGTDYDISAVHPNKGSTQEWVDVTSAIPSGGELQKFYFAGDGQGTANAIKVNGRMLVDTGVIGTDTGVEVKVVSKDKGANTITVDGGKWAANV